MSRSVRLTKTLAAASATAVALSQTPLAAGNLTINGVSASGGVATFASQRRVLFTFAASEVGRVFTVYGTNESGSSIIEAVAGAASTAVTLLDFKTVTRIAVDGATAGALTVGTNGVGATPWISFDFEKHPVPFSLAVTVTGTVNYTVQYTYDDLNSWQPYIRNPNDASPILTTWNDPVLVAATASGETTFDNPITGWRIQINSGTGSIAAVGIQAGLQG
jgi:hypothetical protein